MVFSCNRSQMRNLECKFKFIELKKNVSDFLIKKNKAAVIKMFLCIQELQEYVGASLCHQQLKNTVLCAERILLDTSYSRVPKLEPLRARAGRING
jgi:hypothetical protein